MPRPSRQRSATGFKVRDWSQEHAAYFRAIRIEKTMMSLILMLVVAVAAFNIVAALVMVVNEKRSDIAILRTLGLAPRGVVGVFLTQGLVIGAIGTLIGTVLGVLVAENVGVIVPALEHAFGFHVMDPTVYYITELPSELRAGQVVAISSIAFLLTVLATIYPAIRGARDRAGRGAAVRMMEGRAPFEVRIGRRYLRSTGNRFLSFISLISMLGVAIGVAVLIVVLSVMNGFETRAQKPHPQHHLACDPERFRRGSRGLAGDARDRARRSARRGRGTVRRGRGAADRRPAAGRVRPGERARHRPGARGDRLGDRRPAAQRLARRARSRVVSDAARFGAGRPPRRRAGRQRGDGGRAGLGHARGRRAAHAPVHGERGLLLRHVRDRQRPRARRASRTRNACSAWATA